MIGGGALEDLGGWAPVLSEQALPRAVRGEAAGAEEAGRLVGWRTLLRCAGGPGMSGEGCFQRVLRCVGERGLERCTAGARRVAALPLPGPALWLVGPCGQARFRRRHLLLRGSRGEDGRREWRAATAVRSAPAPVGQRADQIGQLVAWRVRRIAVPPSRTCRSRVTVQQATGGAGGVGRVGTLSSRSGSSVRGQAGSGRVRTGRRGGAPRRLTCSTGTPRVRARAWRRRRSRRSDMGTPCTLRLRRRQFWPAARRPPARCTEPNGHSCPDRFSPDLATPQRSTRSTGSLNATGQLSGGLINVP